MYKKSTVNAIKLIIFMFVSIGFFISAYYYVLNNKGIVESTYTPDVSPAATGEIEFTDPIRPDPIKPVEPEFGNIKTILQKYEKMLVANNEVSGWIKVEGTKIDYPLLQHTDNDCYLHMDISGNASKRGCIFIDCENKYDLSDKNTLIFGHNMKDGSMFRDLVRYKNKDFFYSHRLIEIDNLFEDGIWEVFSVYVLDADTETIDINHDDIDAFLSDTDKYKKRSLFTTDTEINSDDRIVTLITCSYEKDNSRTVVHAKYIGKKPTNRSVYE
jgi:sortase B